MLEVLDPLPALLQNLEVWTECGTLGRHWPASPLAVALVRWGAQTVTNLISSLPQDPRQLQLSQLSSQNLRKLLPFSYL